MNPYEIYLAYVSWNGDGKTRPVLIISTSNDKNSVYSITTQYESKSKAIQAKYYKINDWQQAGLERQSYIDTETLIRLPLSAFINKKLIGTLTEKDRLSLVKFIK